MGKTDIPTTYDPKQMEERIYQFWLDGGYFHAEPDPDPGREHFVIMMPPPNITGRSISVTPSTPRFRTS